MTRLGSSLDWRIPGSTVTVSGAPRKTPLCRRPPRRFRCWGRRGRRGRRGRGRRPRRPRRIHPRRIPSRPRPRSPRQTSPRTRASRVPGSAPADSERARSPSSSREARRSFFYTRASRPPPSPKARAPLPSLPSRRRASRTTHRTSLRKKRLVSLERFRFPSASTRWRCAPRSRLRPNASPRRTAREASFCSPRWRLERRDRA